MFKGLSKIFRGGGLEEKESDPIYLVPFSCPIISNMKKTVRMGRNSGVQEMKEKMETTDISD